MHQTPIVVLVRKPPPILTYAVTIYLSILLSLGLLWRSSFVLAGLYVLISALMIYKWHRGSDLCLYFTGLRLDHLGKQSLFMLVPGRSGCRLSGASSPYLSKNRANNSQHHLKSLRLALCKILIIIFGWGNATSIIDVGQKAGLIRYSRGKIVILDRTRLEG